MRFRCEADRWTAAPLRLTGRVLTTAPGNPKGGARFTFTASTNGCYALAGLARAGGMDAGKSDSFWISLNGGQRRTWDLQGGCNLTWATFVPRENGATNGIMLRSGETLRVDLSAREPEAQLCKLSLMPYGAALPSAPDENPENGVTLAADDAAPLNPPFLLQTLTAGAPTEGARLTVFPVTTDARHVTNRWFATSREGTHPRLEHTVRGVEPRFLMVLVPGSAGTPLPQVRALAVKNGLGAEIRWGGTTDQILFGEGEASAAGIATDGRAAFVRRTSGTPMDWALLDGTRLCVDGQERFPLNGRRAITGTSTSAK
jgi:hypothetical protein